MLWVAVATWRSVYKLAYLILLGCSRHMAYGVYKLASLMLRDCSRRMVQGV